MELEENKNNISEENQEDYSLEREVKSSDASESYWQIVLKQFRKSRLAVWSWRLIVFVAFLAVFSDFLADNKPIVCEYQGEIYFPVVREYGVDMGIVDWQSQFEHVDWKTLQFDWAVWPPVPYQPNDIDYYNTYASPFQHQEVKSAFWHHWLGTDNLGHDVLSGMIHGTRIALLVGVISMAIAGIIGIFFGAIAGYYGDEYFKMSIAGLILNIIALFAAFFYAFGARSAEISHAADVSNLMLVLQILLSIVIFIIIFFIFNLIAKGVNKIPYINKKITIPVDIIISRLIEVMVSIPSLFLIITISAVVEPSIFMVMVVIGVTSWPGIARFIRGELLRIRSLEYIEASKSLGYSEFRTIVKHAIPNALSPVLIAVAFGIASAILIAATLSFIGIGVPAETITWGSMLTQARQVHDAWWLGIFPGLAIFITVTIYNLVGEGLSDAMDPKKKH